FPPPCTSILWPGKFVKRVRNRCSASASSITLPPILITHKFACMFLVVKPVIVRACASTRPVLPTPGFRPPESPTHRVHPIPLRLILNRDEPAGSALLWHHLSVPVCLNQASTVRLPDGSFRNLRKKTNFSHK